MCTVKKFELQFRSWPDEMFGLYVSISHPRATIPTTTVIVAAWLQKF